MPSTPFAETLPPRRMPAAWVPPRPLPWCVVVALLMAAAALIPAASALAAGGRYIVSVGKLSNNAATGVDPATVFSGLNVDQGAGGQFGVQVTTKFESETLSFSPPTGTALERADVWPSIRAYGWPAMSTWTSVTSSWGDWNVGGSPGDVTVSRLFGSGGSPLTTTSGSLAARVVMNSSGAGTVQPGRFLTDRVVLTLADASDPALDDTPAADALLGPTTSGWHTGATGHLTATLHDSGSGVRYVLLRDGTIVHRYPVAPANTTCRTADPAMSDTDNYTAVVPCPTASATYTVGVDLAELGDGDKDLRLGAQDAAGNQAFATQHYLTKVNAPGGSLPDPGTTGPGGCTYADDGVTCVAPAPPPDGDGGGGSGGSGTVTPVQPAGGGGGGSGGGGGGGGTAVVRETPKLAPAPAPVPVVTAPPIVAPRQPGNGSGWSAQPRMCAGGRREACTATAGGAGISRVVVRYGTRVPITGRLVRPDGRPIAHAAIEVRTALARPGARTSAIHVVRTDARGVYRYVVPVGPSRTVTFGYRARLGDERYARSSAVEVAVVPRIRLRTNRRAVRNRHAVRFAGRVDGAPRWARRTVEMRVRVGGTWRTFGTARLHHGRFHYRYLFQRTTRRTTYRFRVRALPESGWPFEGGHSHTTRVTVRP